MKEAINTRAWVAFGEVHGSHNQDQGSCACLVPCLVPAAHQNRAGPGRIPSSTKLLTKVRTLLRCADGRHAAADHASAPQRYGRPQRGRAYCMGGAHQRHRQGKARPHQAGAAHAPAGLSAGARDGNARRVSERAHTHTFCATHAHACEPCRGYAPEVTCVAVHPRCREAPTCF